MNPSNPPTGSTFVNPTSPDTPDKAEHGKALAADVIRQKIDALYADEPSLQTAPELPGQPTPPPAQPSATPAPAPSPTSKAPTHTPRVIHNSQFWKTRNRNLHHSHKLPAASAAVASNKSKHQEYMEQLTSSGKPLPDIQTDWHEYYTKLPDHEKHEVWQEFYSVHAAAKQQPAIPQAAPKPQTPATQALSAASAASKTLRNHLSANTRSLRKRHLADKRTVGDIKKQLVSTVNARSQLKPKHHVQSLLFGGAMGSIVLLVMLFGFFNERIIAPFVTPSKSVSNTPIIIDPGSTIADTTPKVIIPKINVEIPVVYDQPSIAEKDVQASLENGVVHYATTSSPGEQGNAVIFGHSSNNILNRGKYKFAFVLLNRLQEGDTFMLTKDGKRYVYRVYHRRVVRPTDISVLGATDRPATATLITCDPPGTSLNRLIVLGEQISPDPNANIASSAKTTEQKPVVVPGNAPSLWQRFRDWAI